MVAVTPLLLASLSARPPVSQQITWFYSNSLAKGAGFLTTLGFDEINGTKQKSICRIFHAAPSHYLGVCDSRPAATCPHGPEGAPTPPVTYTLVVPTTTLVDDWHEHLVGLGKETVTVTTPGHSTRFGCYAFNFYDTDRDNGLGCYRFEVQSFEDPAWPKPQCPPIATPAPLAIAAPPPMPSAAPPPPRVLLDLFVASKCPDAPRCESMLEPVLEAVGAIVDVRLGFLGEVRNTGETTCLHGPSECVGNKAQLCTHAHWPYHVDVEVHRLPAHLNWLLFLRCVAEDASGKGQFNHTATSLIPQNTNGCLQRYAVPSATADAIDACVNGEEGKMLLNASITRTHQYCGHHSSAPGKACKSCEMYLEGKPVCVLDDARVYNCTGLGSDPQKWIARICAAAITKGWAPSDLPLACRVPTTMPVSSKGWPKVWGHSYASINPKASADFAVKYFGATLLRDDAPQCAGPASSSQQPPREVSVKLPMHTDYRGGGLVLRFVSNPRKPSGGSYGISAHVAAMKVLFGNLSINSGHHWNQFFDSHLGFYARPSSELAMDLLRDGVPFFTGQSSGIYQSIYVVIPGTAHVVEVLGQLVCAEPAAKPHSLLEHGSILLAKAPPSEG